MVWLQGLGKPHFLSMGTGGMKAWGGALGVFFKRLGLMDMGFCFPCEPDKKIWFSIHGCNIKIFLCCRNASFWVRNLDSLEFGPYAGVEKRWVGRLFMVLLTAIFAMACVYYGYDRGFVIGFMLALFCEILSLILLYNLLKRTEERVGLRLNPLIEEQRNTLKQVEALAEKRALVLDALVRSQPELSELVQGISGEHFPRDREDGGVGSGKAGENPSQ
jgi:hypothetical protein